MMMNNITESIFDVEKNNNRRNEKKKVPDLFVNVDLKTRPVSSPLQIKIYQKGKNAATTKNVR